MGQLDSILLSPTMVKPGDHDPYTPSALRNLDLSILFDGDPRHVWLGHFPPFNCTAIDLASTTSFRASAMLHGQFDVVWCCSSEAITDLTWPVVLDEAIRLIRGKGHLVLRFPDDFGPMVRVKSFLARKHGVTIDIVDELRSPHGLFAILHVERDVEVESASQAAWTIGILSSGNRPEVVLRMLESIRSSTDGWRHEIILFGHSSEAFAKFDVRCFSDEKFGIRSNLNEISRKKNIIASEAKHENLLICHDRYVLGQGFFESFEDFGYDFDFVTVPQIFDDGQMFPALGLVGGLKLNTLNYIGDFTEYHDNAYINGGFIIIKASLIKSIPMNALSFWNQGEDAEFAAVLRERGVIPRVNAAALAITSGISKQHVSQFKNVDGQGELLLDHFRWGCSPKLKHHWRHRAYRVSERSAVVAKVGGVTLVLVGDPDLTHAAIALDFQSDDANAKIWYRSSNDGRWCEFACLERGADGTRRGRMTVQLRDGYCELAFRMGWPFAGSLDEQEGGRDARAGLVTLATIDDVRPVTLEFDRGSFGLESDGLSEWQWLRENAGLVILNPNRFPVSCVLRFTPRHFASGGSTLLQFPGGGGVAVTDAEAPELIAIAMVLKPGATQVDLKSTGAFRDTRGIGDTRPLSLMLQNWNIEMFVKTTEHAADWRATTPFTFGLDGVEAHALFADMDPAVRYMTIAGEAVPAAANGFDLQIGAVDQYSQIMPEDGLFCLEFPGQPVLAHRPHLLRRSEAKTIRIRSLVFTEADPWEAPTFVATIAGRLLLGESLRFGRGETGSDLLGRGWSIPEAEGVWSCSRKAMVGLNIGPQDTLGGSLKMSVDVNVFCSPELGFRPECSIWVNGRRLHVWTPEVNDFQTVFLDIDPFLVPDGRVEMEFRQAELRSPKQLGLSNDTRMLGCRLRELRFHDSSHGAL